MVNYIRYALEALRVTQRGWSAGLNVSNVFIPAGGLWDDEYISLTESYRYYWAIDFYPSYTLYAWYLDFGLNTNITITYYLRDRGKSIRSVRPLKW